jgi:MYXO-CTERM domain-containing protein
MRSRIISPSRWFLAGLVLLAPLTAHALDPFVNASATLQNDALTSGVAMGIADMNADGLDDIVRLHDAEELQIEYQQPDGTFVLLDYGSINGGSWTLAIGDADHNGYPDIFTAGAYDGKKLLLANEDGTDYQLTTLPNPSIFAQCSNFADIDANGTLDLFVCHDDGISAAFNNDGTGSYTYDLGLISAASTIPSDNSGNYGSTWTDYDNDGDLDLYIAKCRLGVANPLDGRRLNLLFQNDGNNNYTDVAEAAGLRPLAQSWSADFADIENDGDLDVFLVTHDVTSQLYLNEGPGASLGTFTDITASSGMTADLVALGLGIQTHFEDFDNDTFVDLLVTGRSGQHRLFMNDGDGTFTAAVSPFPTGGLVIQSAVVGDLDDDGFPDVLAGFATGYNNPSNNPDRLFINPGNDNHWVNIRLTGVASNATGVGARVEVTGEWGTQIREVRAGESYGTNNSATRHFGLGAAETIESIVVRWPSGAVDTIDDPPIDLTLHVTEGCVGTFYTDADGDGFGDPAGKTTTGCIPPAGFAGNDIDCADDEPATFPGNPEICDDIDNDCDREIDDGLECSVGTSSEGGESSSTTQSAVDTGSGDSTTGAGPSTDDGADSTGGDSSSSTGEPSNDSSGTIPTPVDPTMSTGDDSTGGTDPGETEGGGGCGCVAGSNAEDRGALALLLLALGGLRRRRVRLP